MLIYDQNISDSRWETDICSLKELNKRRDEDKLALSRILGGPS